MTDVEVTDVEVKESAIQGPGVIAAREFSTGERVRRVNIVREVTEDAPVRQDRGERIEHCGYPNGKVVLWGSPDGHLNHSCEPNAGEAYGGDAI